MNNKTKEAFPSLQTISEVNGAAINTIRKCIKNLEKADYITIRKKEDKTFIVLIIIKNLSHFL